MRLDYQILLQSPPNLTFWICPYLHAKRIKNGMAVMILAGKHV